MNLTKQQRKEKLVIEYQECIKDLIDTDIVQSMSQYIQHGDVTCLDHCKKVSWKSYKISKRLKLDYRSAARGGLLHDFFLYDWHIPGSHVGFHGFRHSKTSLENALKHFDLNHKERDIIVKHMWPLNIVPPRFLESVVVTLVDKYYSSIETTITIKNWLKSLFKKKKHQ